ncbi:fimbrial protein [Desulfuromonas versatilis]|uniref:Fimbrial protein n=1 Tax=Desulfuromonas versatilis TaxID=2802975 RepID=A0ABN6E0Q6_9BACT|nr:PilN domain-containing protein [Desulfuromonas versatilis]BCR05767.1 fimbrial protein [Desulfuromonas versatilis]
MKPTLNLASRTYLNRRAVNALYLILGIALVALLAWNGAAIFQSRSQGAQLRARLAELEQEMASRRGSDADFSPAAQQQLHERIAFANEIILQDSFSWTGLLDRLEEVLPAGVRISEIQPDYKDSSLRLVGLARNVGDMRNFLDRLMQSAEFSDVYLLSQGRVDFKEGASQQSVVGFSIVVKGAF